MSFYTKLSNGWKLAKMSLQVLKENKQLIVFPILAGASFLLIIGSFIVGTMSVAGWNIDNIDTPDTALQYGLIFGFYLVNYFIIVFFNVALTHCTRLYFRGEEVTIRAGLLFSFSRIGAILSWALFAATVGTILKAIQENFGFLGKILGGLLGIVWTVTTFFVVPIIAYENVGPLAAYKRSAQMMKQKWGESIAASFSFGALQVVAFFVIVIPMLVLATVIDPMIPGIIAVVALLLIVAVVNACQSIFISAVYHNQEELPSGYFGGDVLEHLFVKAD
jgi:hypothetical protein